jgi:hypothetical protein
MLRRQQPIDGFHVLGGRRVRFLGFLTRQLHGHLVAGRVRRHLGVVEDHRQRRHCLADRLARLPIGVQRHDQVGDVLWPDRVDATVTKRRQRPVERGSMLNRGSSDPMPHRRKR